MISFAVFVLGLAIGCVVTSFLWRSKAEIAIERVKGEGELTAATLRERSQNQETLLGEKQVSLELAQADYRKLLSTATALKQREAQLVQLIKSERLETKKLEDAQSKLTIAFKALASDALSNNNSSFLELANQTLEKFHQAAKGDLEKRQEAVSQLVKPVKDSLDKVDQQIQQIEKDRAAAYSGLTEQVKALNDGQLHLRSETSNLVSALRAPTVRGRWGEIQLKRVVELAGMLEYCDFCQQESVTTEDGQFRPDLVVKLPASKNIVVDSKVPLSCYLEAIATTDEQIRKAKFEAHAGQIRSHIAALSKKSYHAKFGPAPEFVILFLPGEVFYNAALEYDPELIEIGAAQNVIIATPATLIALLKAIAFGWTQERLAENAKEISDRGQELYKRLSDMGGHFARLGKNLNNSVEAYNKAVGSLESRVLVTARRFQDLGIRADEIEPLQPIEQFSRALDAPELKE